MKQAKGQSDNPRFRILSAITTPYEDLLAGGDSDAQYFLDLIKLKIALSTNLLSLEQAHEIGEALHQDNAAALGTFIPIYEPWTKEMIEHIVDNLRHLKKHRVVTAKQLNAAVYDTLGHERPHRVPVGTKAEVLKYFGQFPLDSFTDAARRLKLHRSTVYEAYKKLQARHWVRTLGHNNVTAFGLRHFTLLFTLQDTNDWKRIQEGLQRFPFIRGVQQIPNSDLHVASFLIPGSKENIAAFRAGVRKVSSEFLDYSSLHMYEGSGRFFNTSLLRDGHWELPECIVEKRFKPPRSYSPSVAATECHEQMRELTYEDFVLEETLCMNLRMPPSEAQSHLKAQGIKMDKRRVSLRRRFFLDKRILTPFLWFGRVGFHYNVPVEVVCDAASIERLLDIFSGFPLVYLYFRSDRGVILFIETPQDHLSEYHKFLGSLSRLQGVNSIRSWLQLAYVGGRPYRDIVSGLEYGDDGFLTASDDIRLTDYIEMP
ncbi:MAG: hypothetical protein EAX95_03950 [Candidatus Thorarchaeota archaeon]|nr:hypothetical protein [Candidatus Thorarchaeota archaeon]